MNPEPQVRRGLLARTLFETLRDAGEPLAPKDALAGVASRITPNNQELSRNASGFPRYETFLRWVSTWASSIGWMAKRGGWSITEAGVEAIAEFAGEEFVSELTRRYRLHRKQKQQTVSGYGDPRWAEVVTCGRSSRTSSSPPCRRSCRPATVEYRAAIPATLTRRARWR